MSYTAAILTISDKGARGEREDKSGPVLCELAAEHGYQVVYTAIIPDEKDQIQAELIKCSDELHVNLVLTTGGTGFPHAMLRPRQRWQWWNAKRAAFLRPCAWKV